MPISDFGNRAIQGYLECLRNRMFAYRRDEMVGLREKWTTVTQECFFEMATSRKLTQRSRHRDNGGEFLLDITWFDSTSSMKLAAEVEFNSGAEEFLNDFRKLVHFKCDTKPMISDPWPHEWLPQVAVNELSNYGDHHIGEEYLILYLGCFFGNDTRKCGCQPALWTWSPQVNGLSPVTLESVPMQPFTLPSRPVP